MWFPRDCITHQLQKLFPRFSWRLQKVQWMNFHQLDGIAENTACTISKEMIILLLGFSPWSELMERMMSFASWLLPKHPSSLLGGVASLASGMPGLAPLCPDLRAVCLSAWQPIGGRVVKVWGCLCFTCCVPTVSGAVSSSLLIPGPLSDARIHGAQEKYFTNGSVSERRVLLTSRAGMWPLRPATPHPQSQSYPAWQESSSQDQAFPGGRHSSPSDAALLACFLTQNRFRFLWGNPLIDLRCQPPPMEDIPGGSDGKASA